MKKKRIVLIGGGNGCSNIARGINPDDFDVSVILAMADSGGSTGALREQYAVPPLGDIRKAISRTSTEPGLAELLEHRFEGGDLDGHTLGNLVLLAAYQTNTKCQIPNTKGNENNLELGTCLPAGKVRNLELSYKDKNSKPGNCPLVTGNCLETTIKEVQKLGGSNIRILPCSYEPYHLVMETSDGERVVGEGVIDTMEYEEIVKGFFLDPLPSANPKAIQAIDEADLVCVGPGSLHTSLFPALMTDGISDAIKASSAKKVFVAHLTNQKGQTEKYRIQDYVEEVSSMMGEDIFDTVILDRSRGNEAFDDRCIVAHVTGGTNVKGGGEKGRNCGKMHDPEKLWKVLKTVL